MAKTKFYSKQECEKILFFLHTKLRTYSVLLRNLNGCIIEQDDLYGLATTMEKIYKKLEWVQESMAFLDKAE